MQERFTRHGIPAEENQQFQGVCRSLLQLATGVRVLANKFLAADFDIRGVEEMDIAVLTVRRLLRDLMDSADPDTSPMPAITGARQTAAPDSWYTEDHSKLLGPFT